MMLSRVADALFWMGRYLERADHLARAVEVTSSLELDLHGVLADPIEFEWTALLAQYQQSSPHRRDTETAISAAQRWLLTDIENTGSVIACINRGQTTPEASAGRSVLRCGENSTNSTGGSKIRICNIMPPRPLISFAKKHKWGCSFSTVSATRPSSMTKAGTSFRWEDTSNALTRYFVL